MFYMTPPWHHSPVNYSLPEMTYMVTASTCNKAHFFNGEHRLEYLQNTLLELLERHDWRIHCWSVFVNHYHFIANSPKNGTRIPNLIKELHSRTSRTVNSWDGVRGRQVWFQYWDTCLTYEKSWLVRMNYVHNNPVKHGLVKIATHYPYCSASWFLQNASTSFRRKVESFRFDKLKINDDF
jgi:putative transposase